MLVKKRRLPDIDLARITVLPSEQQAGPLAPFVSGGGSWSYGPARARQIDIFNARTPLGLQTDRPSLEALIALTLRKCPHPEQAESCEGVVRAMYEWVDENISDAVEVAIPAMVLGSRGSVRYWDNFVAKYGNRQAFFFPDHRRTRVSTADARRFQFSVMHEQIRRTMPDFADAQLVVLRFMSGEGRSRRIVPHTDDGIQLFDVEEMQEMVATTYKILDRLVEKDAEQKRAA